jgi:hypothetical protein
MIKAKEIQMTDSKEMRVLKDARRKENIFNFELQDVSVKYTWTHLNF